MPIKYSVCILSDGALTLGRSLTRPELNQRMRGLAAGPVLLRLSPKVSP